MLELSTGDTLGPEVMLQPNYPIALLFILLSTSLHTLLTLTAHHNHHPQPCRFIASTFPLTMAVFTGSPRSVVGGAVTYRKLTFFA